MDCRRRWKRTNTRTVAFKFYEILGLVDCQRHEETRQAEENSYLINLCRDKKKLYPKIYCSIYYV